METSEIIKSLRDISNMRSASNFKRTICKAAAQRFEQLSAELEKVTAERDAAISLLRNVNWCAGCINFKGLEGCADNAMSVCDKGNDHYQFDYRFGSPELMESGEEG